MDENAETKNRPSYIFGRKIKDQARLLRLARQESSAWRKIRLEDFHYRYLLGFFRRHYGLIIGLLALLFAQGIIESALIVFSRNQLSGQSRIWLASNFWPLFCVLIAVFLLNAFFAIRYERSLLVMLANGIRRRLFKSYLERPLESVSSERQAELIAKISYHLPLVSLGLSNSFFGLWRWLVYGAIIIAISLIGGYHTALISACFIAISGAIALSAYALSRLYVSQEVTFYSRIIKEADYNASNMHFLKGFGQEGSALGKFDKLVWLDSFFRVRRDVLMRIGFKIVFVLLVIVSIFSHFFSQSFFSFIGLTSFAERFLFLFLLLYFSRALNEAAKIGLYLFPACLGLFLTILRPGRTSVKDAAAKLQTRGKTLTFYSHKAKLFTEGPYYRRLKFIFKPGDRISFIGDNLSGKTSLAKVFAGIAAYNPRAFKVIAGNERFEFAGWQKSCLGAYYFDPNFRTDRSLMECLLGRTKEAISMEKFSAAIEIMNAYPEIVHLVSGDGNYNSSAASVLANPTRAFALHALHALIVRPDLAVIDNFWLDLEYPLIAAMSKSLEQALPASIIVTFSRRPNGWLAYNQQYEIKDKITQLR